MPAYPTNGSPTRMPGMVLSSGILDHEGKPWGRVKEDGFDLPHVLTFAALIGNAYRAYYQGQHDDAVRNDPEFAEAMRRDPHLRALLQERKMSTVSLKWHLEVPNERDKEEKAIKDGLTTVVAATPWLKQLFNNLLDAIWFGRAGAELEYQDRRLLIATPSGEKIKRYVPCVRNHVAIEGDKINFHYDGTPIIQVYGPAVSDIPNADFTMTTASRGIALRGTWRRKFIIHKHETPDANFWRAEQAGSIHGVGIRSTLFWLAWLKKELLANVLDYCERTGLGLRVWYYQGGNTASEAAVANAAKNQTDRTNVLVPRFPNQAGKASEGVEFVDTGSNGAVLLLDILKHFDDQVERFVIGQTLSAGTEGGGLGGTGVASLHAMTKHKLIAFDADNLAECLTQDWIRPLCGWIYPDQKDLPISLKFDINVPDPAEVMASANAFYAMGGTLSETAVSAVTGLESPQEGDKTLSQMKLAEEMASMQQPAQTGILGGDELGGAMPGTDNPGMPGGQMPGMAGGEEPRPEDYEEIVSHLTGGAGKMDDAGAMQMRKGEPERYMAAEPTGTHAQSVTKPLDPKIIKGHAGRILRTHGDDAYSHMSQVVSDLKAHSDSDPKAARLLQAAHALLHALEPDDDDYEAVKKMLGILGPKTYAMGDEPHMATAAEDVPTATALDKIPMATLSEKVPKATALPKLPHVRHAADIAGHFPQQTPKVRDTIGNLAKKLAEKANMGSDESARHMYALHKLAGELANHWKEKKPVTKESVGGALLPEAEEFKGDPRLETNQNLWDEVRDEAMDSISKKTVADYADKSPAAKRDENDTFAPRQRTISDDPVEERDTKSASIRTNIEAANQLLSAHGIGDVLATNLAASPQLRTFALKNPEGFDRQMAQLDVRLRSAIRFGLDWEAGSAKLNELNQLRKDVHDFRTRHNANVLDLNELPPHFKRKGASTINIRSAIDHLSGGGNPKSAVNHLMKNAGLERASAQKYVRAAVRYAAAKADGDILKFEERLKDDAPTNEPPRAG